MRAWVRDRRDPGPQGKQVTQADIHLLVGESTRIHKPNGDLLCAVIRGAIPKKLTDAARPALDLLKNATTTNRGAASGNERWLRKRRDGKTSATNVAPPVHSSVIGYFDRYPRIPYCRQTSFNAKHPATFDKAILPLTQEIGRLFGKHVPDRFKVQNDRARATSPDFVIRGTPFTTLTVNHNWPTKMHKDAGDLAEGFSCLAVLRGEDVGLGSYEGCELVMPEYGVGVALRTGDLLLMDAHEWHGNTEFRNTQGDFRRCSVVLYYREGMAACGTAKQELARAKNLRGRLDPEEMGG